jgi:dihydrofolate synthase/folylpolyglutamate synthase
MGNDAKLDSLVKGHIPIQNVSTGLAVLQRLEIPLTRECINIVLRSLVVEGRFSMVSDRPMIIVDVAHNPQSSAYLAQQLDEFARQGYEKVSAVVGMLSDKDIDGVLANVSDQIDRWYLADLPTSRGAKSDELAQSLEKLQVTQFSCYDCVATGLQQAKEELEDKGLIIVFGSFLTVAAALPMI